MRYLLLIFISCFSIFPVYGYEIAFPLEKELTIEQDGIFFIGKVQKNEVIKIISSILMG